MATLKQITKIAEELGWCVTTSKTTANFQQFTTAGQDFNMEINIKGLEQNIKEFYENYDVNYETKLWIDQWGHGSNGAPHDMADVLADMQECENILKDLVDAIDGNHGPKMYALNTQFVFSGIVRVRASSIIEARKLIQEQVGMSCGNIHSTINDDDVDWDFDMTPDKIIQ